MQWPCPSWYHVPTSKEWWDLITAWWWWSDWVAMSNALKLPKGGYNMYSNWSHWGVDWYYWTSSPAGTAWYHVLMTDTYISSTYNNPRAFGFNVRCFSDTPATPTYTNCSATTQDWYSIPQTNHGATTATLTKTWSITWWVTTYSNIYTCNNWALTAWTETSSITCNTNYTLDWTQCNWIVPTTGLVAEYLFEDSTDLGKDTAGTYNGTNNWATQTTWINWGNAVIATADNHISLPNNVYPSPTQFTFSMWFKLNWTPSWNIQLIHPHNQYAMWFSYRKADSKIGFSVRSSSNWKEVLSNTLISQWQYYLITFVKDWTNWEIYINGNLDSYWTLHNTADTLSWTSSIFAYYSADPNNHNIDNLRIYNRALSQTEITQLYAEWLSDPNTELPFVYGTEQPSNHFNTVTYTGNWSNQSISSLNFQPDFTWIKNRNGPWTVSHGIWDSIRWPYKYLRPNATDGEAIWTAGLSNFTSNGFDLDYNVHVNENWYNYVAWNWKAGWAAVSNSDWTITSQVSANPTAGFSIMGYTGNWSNSTIGHGLNKSPEMVIVKRRDISSGYSWHIQHASVGNTRAYFLDSSNTWWTNSIYWNNTSPTSSTISVGTDTSINASSGSFISYAFHSVPGYSKIGSYKWTGVSWNKVELGFKPAYVMLKRIDSANHWYTYDNKRANDGHTLYPNLPNAEYTWTDDIDFLSDGFNVNTTANTNNVSWWTYIYYAISE